MKTNTEFPPAAEFYIKQSNLELANGDPAIRQLVRLGMQQNILQAAIAGVEVDAIRSHINEISRQVGNRVALVHKPKL